MEEEPSLPILNPNGGDYLINPTRKRVRNSSFTAFSSDPPLFSSDDDPSADNYSIARTKKKLRGPWYDLAAGENGQGDKPTKRSKRKFERQYDSGVFLGSDGTDLGDGLDFPGKERAAGRIRRESRSMSRIQQPQKSEEDIWLERRIQECLEAGNENVDLSSGNLSKLSGSIIRSLSTLTPVRPSSLDVFSDLEPNLKVFLSQNELTTLPEELFHLERLHTLTVRANKIREIPDGISNLLNLKELNLAQNELQYLPFSILRLFAVDSNLRSFTIHPNPFLQALLPSTHRIVRKERIFPQEPSSDGGEAKISLQGSQAYNCIPDRTASDDLNQLFWSPRWNVTFHASTAITFFDNAGRAVQGKPPTVIEGNFRSIESDIDPQSKISNPDTGLPVATGVSSSAPSLREVVLQSMVKNSKVSQVKSYLPDEYIHLHRLLDTAVECKESGLPSCTICHRPYVLKRTEWIEWWEITEKKKPRQGMHSAASPLGRIENERDILEGKVPLIRRGCSWWCVPAQMNVREEIEVEVEDDPSL